MEAFRITVFTLSIIILPLLTVIAAESRMRIPGKILTIAALSVAARYLIGVVWVPESMAMLMRKELCVLIVLGAVLLGFKRKLKNVGIRPWVAFAVFMILPFVAKFWCATSLAAHGIGLMGIWPWVAWTLLGLWFATSFGEQKNYTLGAHFAVFVVAVAILAFMLVRPVKETAISYAGNLKEQLRIKVVERWEPLKRGTDAIVAAWDQLIDKDRRAMANGKVGKGKLLASASISSQIVKLQRELLTIDSRAVLCTIDNYNDKIASTKKKLSSLREKRGLKPEQAAKLDAKIAKAETDLAELEAGRADAIAKVRGDLKEIGLDLPENSPLLTVDVGALINNAIIAKNIGFLVENLKSNMEAAKGDAEAAKRYYGGYIVMLDVQTACLRQYLDKAATGIWRDGIKDVEKNAEAAKRNNEAKAAAEGRTEDAKVAFLHAAATNDKTLKVAQTYLAILQHHEDVIKEKLAAIEKRHEIALSFWESVDIASKFGDQIAADLADFNALLELKLPEIAFFDDAEMQKEFDAITEKLRKE